MSRSPQPARLARAAALAIALALVVAGKTYYRHASADELAWLIAPTARCVSLVTGGHFAHEASVGWIDREAGVGIVPACAGLHFLLCALLVLLAAAWPRIARWRDVAGVLAGALVIAYLATIAVDTLRISIAVRMHAAGAGGGDLHALEGTIVYFGGLCALYASARRASARRASARRASARRTTAGRSAVPLAAYVLVALVLPIVNGSLARAGFAHHLMVVLVGVAVVYAGMRALAAAGRIGTPRQGERE